MPCRFASSGTVATSRSASRAILALNVASNFLRDLVISVLHRLRQSRTLHTLTFGPISGVHFKTTVNEQVFKGFGCTGANVSPVWSWRGPRSATKSFAVSIHDPDAPTGSDWWHWVVFNLPPGTASLPT